MILSDLDTQILVRLNLYLLSIFGGLLLFILIKKFVELIQFKSRKRVIEFYEPRIRKYLFSDFKLRIARNTGALLEHLVELLKQLPSDERYKITKLYQKLGFYKNDLKKLKSLRYRHRVRALSRLQNLRIRIPKEILDELINDKYVMVRWIAFDCYIHSYHKESFIPLLYFVQEKRNLGHRGMIYHLLVKYGENNSSDLVFILNRISSPLLIDNILKVLELYPDPLAKDAIYENIRGDMNRSIITSAIKVLANFPDERFEKLLMIYKSHENWHVRLCVAESLKDIHTQDSIEILKELSVDQTFLVRLKACEVLINYSTGSSNRYVAQIFENQKHPSHLIINNLYQFKNFEEVEEVS